MNTKSQKGIVWQNEKFTAARCYWSVPSMNFDFQKAGMTLNMIGGDEQATIYTVNKKNIVLSTILVMDPPPMRMETPVNIIHLVIPVDRIAGFRFDRNRGKVSFFIKQNSMLQAEGELALYDGEPFCVECLSELATAKAPALLSHHIYLDDWTPEERDQYLDHLSSFLPKIQNT